MKRRFLAIILPVFVLVAGIAGCIGTPAATPTTTEVPVTPTVSATLDPCAPGQIQAEVQKVHKHMREFDDASMLASNMQRDQLGDAIARLQKIRRDAEDESIPGCLANLKTYQVSHMNSVINTLTAFMGGSDQKLVDQGISIARQQHDQYTMELARLLGLTVIPAGTAGTPIETQTP